MSPLSADKVTHAREVAEQVGIMLGYIVHRHFNGTLNLPSMETMHQAIEEKYLDKTVDNENGLIELTMGDVG